jgi:hypothetical protein
MDGDATRAGSLPEGPQFASLMGPRTAKAFEVTIQRAKKNLLGLGQFLAEAQNDNTPT